MDTRSGRSIKGASVFDGDLEEIKGTRTFTSSAARCMLLPMPRIARIAPGGLIYHVLNRANGRLTLFRKEDDYLAFHKVVLEAHRRVPIRILDWCIMSNHWHLVLWPRKDGELTAFLRWLTQTHAQRWKAAHAAIGHGHLYQGRFKSFPIQQDEHLLTVLRYVQRNPLRAGLVKSAVQWKWGSAHVRQEPGHDLRELLSDGPVDRPKHWRQWVDQPQTPAEEEAIRLSLLRGRPYGREPWVRQAAAKLNLAQTLRPRGRPPGWRKE